MNKTIKWIVSIPAIIAGVVLVGIMLLTVVDVILRYFFNSPITGSSEITQRFIIVAGFLGMGWCALKDQHIKVDIIVGKLPQKAQKIFSLFNYLVVASISGIIAVYSYKQALLVKRMHVQSQLLAIPNYPFYIVVSIGYLVLLLAVVVLIVHTITGKPTGEERHES